MKRILILLLLLALVLPVFALDEGTTIDGDSKVILEGGTVTVGEKELLATAYTEIDGVRFAPANTKQIGDMLVWETGEKQYFIFDDPTVSMAYQYSGKKLKETITLKEDKILSFPVSLNADSRLIPWDSGQWKIVSVTSGDTMNGIVIEKPYGIDANNKRIEMEYTYVDGKLNLVYNRTITSYTYSEVTTPEHFDSINGTTVAATTQMVATPTYAEITYPLVIDPTWVVVGDREVCTDCVVGYTIIRWTTTGTTSWTPPAGVTSVDYLVVGGGASGGTYAGGGGGGAGEFRTGIGLAVSGTETIVVGNGGAATVAAEDAQGNDGNPSSLTNDGTTITSTGGGGGGAYSTAKTGRNGGSGGGGSPASGAGGTGTDGATVPGNLIGHNGGNGTTITGAYTGGGGGGSANVGANGATGTGGDGGDGTSSSITGTATIYAAGGGAGAQATAIIGHGGSSGIGGDGGRDGTPATAGDANTGSGGGGTTIFPGSSGAGGSGIVIIKYLTPIPSLSLTATPTTSGVYATNVQFEATGTSTINPQNWSFGDGYTSQVRNTTNHYYSVAGNYTANLSITNTTAPFGFVNATVYLNQTSDSDAKLISRMHMNGADGGTTFTAERGSAWTPTSVTTETAQKKFGTASALFNAAGDRLQTPTSNAFDFGTSNFTLEQWVFPTSSGSEQMILSRTTNGNTRPDGWGIYHSTASATSDGWRFWMGTTATQTGTFTLPLNTWSHLVVQRNGAGNVVVYVDGVSVATVTAAGNYDTINVIVYGDPIGGGAAVDSWRGYLDETGISTATRWIIGGSSATFSPPYAEYRGDLFPAYPDVNPGSTLRFKTNPSPPPSEALISNLTGRYRTLQIQYINITNNVSTVILFNPQHFYAAEVIPNTSAFTGINFTEVIIDNVAGTALINATRPGGFNTTGATESRRSFADIRMVYWNYTQPEEDSVWDDDDAPMVQGFGSGFLRNQTNGKNYPVANFIATNVSVTDWQTFSNFTVINASTIVNENITTFRTRNNNFTANRFDWDFGDGSVANTTVGETSHMYTVPGTYTVSSRTYLWQNTSVTNITTMFAAATARYNDTYVVANFTATPIAGSAGVNVLFTDTSFYANATAIKEYNWSFGDCLYSTSCYSNTVGNVQHVYPALGTYTVNLTIKNNHDPLLGQDFETKTNYIVVSTAQGSTALNLLYAKDVNIVIVDVNGVGQPGADVSVVMMNSSVENTNWWNTLLGIPSTADPVRSTFLSGVTSTEGEISFPMVASGLYRLTVSNASAGISMVRTFYPTQTVYVYVVATTASAPAALLVDTINATLYAGDGATSATVNLNLSYEDKLSSTTNIYFYVDDVNTTRLYSTNGILSSTLWNASFPVSNIKTGGYRWGYSATTLMFGTVNGSLGITTKGTDVMYLNLAPCTAANGVPYATGWGNEC